MSDEEIEVNAPIWEMTEDVVISGISGRYPESDNVDELRKNLFDNVDMVTEDDRRWPMGLYGLPARAAKIKDLSKFDAQFFGVHGKQANLMDPQARMLLELTYEAICDSGINPHSLRGSRTGVYIGACVSEVEEGLAQDVSKVSGYALTGCSRSMFANRISYTFDFQGPSYAMDTADSSSFLAFQQAMLGLRSGQCDQAIVGGVNICLRPVTALQFHKLKMLSNDGKCKFLDDSADGYARGEACSVIFLQKKSDARRVYATVIHTKTNTDGYKEEGITYPSLRAQTELMKEVCAEANIDPLEIKYIEANGTGVKICDEVEIKAIINAYCKKRNEPLPIGAIKTNIGHTEPSSGLCSISKVLIAFEASSIPASLHISKVNHEVEGLITNKIKPVTENTPFLGGIAAVNSFGFGGVNVHALLKSNEKKLSEDSYKILNGQIPRLVQMCGRTEAAVNSIFDKIESGPSKVSKEFLALLNEVSKIPASSGMNYRGHMIVKEKADENEILSREVIRVPEKRPLWFVFSGMGSQWPAMAKALMPISIFANAVNNCAEILKPLGVDLLHLLLNEDEEALDTTIAPFVAIAAVQIGLVDILRALGIEPDGIVGHSVGELGCAYADKCFDARQMILSAYWRGKCVEDYHCEHGQMAAVGLAWDECLKRCPDGVFPACHNSEDSVTISGPYKITNEFVEQLKSENIFARAVKSCGVAFHSKYVAPIGPSLLAKLKEILGEPVLRSSKWISSSVPQERWETDSCRYSAPEYYVNNLTSPVLFAGAMKNLPKNGIMIEIAPHTLLQAILKRALGAEISYVGLMKRGNNAANLDMLFSAIGKLYDLGLNPAIENLYPKIEYPVPCGVQSISSLIQWDHSQNWLVTQYPEYFNPSSSSDYVVKVDLEDSEDAYLTGHCIDGRHLYPATGYLMLAWKMLAKIKGQFYDKIPVEFENVTIHRPSILPKTGQTKFVIRMMETSGEFSISEGGAIVASGKVFVPEDPVLKMQHNIQETLERIPEPETITMKTKDIYKEFRIRGYDYTNEFQGLIEATDDGRKGKVKWTGNWISFADSCLQLSILGRKTRALFLPVRFQCVRCDPRILMDLEKEETELSVIVDPRIQLCATKGLEIRGIKTNISPRREGRLQPVLEKYVFVANDEEDSITKMDKEEIEEYLRVCCTMTKKVLGEKLASQYVSDIKDVEMSLVDQYLAGPPTRFALLHTIANIQTIKNPPNLENKVQKAILKHRRDLPKDLLANVYLRERFVRPSLDIITENVGKEMNVIEINSTSLSMNSPIKDYLEISGVKVDYTIAHPAPRDLGTGIPSDIKLIEWCLSSSNMTSEMSNSDLILYKDNQAVQNGINFGSLLKCFYNNTKANGFLMAFFRSELTGPERFLYKKDKKLSQMRIEDFLEKAKTQGYGLVSKKFDGIGSMTLLLRKKITKDAKNQSLVAITLDKYNWINELKEKMNEHAEKPEGENIWLLGREPPKNGIIGLVHTLRKEPQGNRIRCIFDLNKTIKEVDFNSPSYKNILDNDLTINIISQNQLGSYRHFSMNHIEEDGMVKTNHAYLNVMTRGDLSSLKWFQSNEAEEKEEKGTRCQIYYAPLNFRDVMLASGKIPPDALPKDMILKECVLGLEFAGRDPNGKRVMGMVSSKGLATDVLVTESNFCWEVPDNWSLLEASTVPVAYATAYYALCVRGGLQPGETVLIHSGSGGVGQAAISISLNLGCQVFATVSNQEKRDFLKKIFPQIKDRNLANSRNTSFEQHVLRETKGRGVDLVLNSLSDEKMHASIRCLAHHGRFLEIGKYDLSQNNPIGMSAFLKNIAFHGILLDSLFMAGPDAAPGVLAQKEMVSQFIQEGIKTGAVKPINQTIYSINEAEEAFRYMTTGKHIGKVVLKIREEEKNKIATPKPVTIKAIARTFFLSEKSYIITGGTGGVGLELAFWMANRGARKFVLSCHESPNEPYQKLSLKRLRSLAQVVVSTADVTSSTGTKKLLEDGMELGPVGGIFHLAGNLADGLMVNQTVDSFTKTCNSKVQGIYNLDKASREPNIMNSLDYFVAFSSFASGRGNPGQSNYAFANSVMERVCEDRKESGLPGLAIQWGAIGDVGMAMEKMASNENEIGSTLPQRIPSCMASIDRFLQSPYAICSSFVRSRRREKVSSNKDELMNIICHILGIKDADCLHSTITLGDLGLDSLMGVEVKQVLERNYDVLLSLQEIRSLSLYQLKQISLGNLAVVKDDDSNLHVDFSMPNLGIPMSKSIVINEVKEGKPVFFLPSLEGVFKLLEPLAKLLKRPAIGLFWTPEIQNMKDGIKAVAEAHLKTCREIQPEEELDIIGYSFGGLVALQMAQDDNVGNLIMLDSSPALMNNVFDKHKDKIRAKDNDELHAEALLLFLSQFLQIDYDKILSEISAIEDHESRNTRAIELYMDYGGPKCDEEAIQFSAQAFHRKLKMIKDYEKFKFDKKIDMMLIRAESLQLKMIETNLSHDYNLSQVSEGEITVRTMKGDHENFLINNLKAIAALINGTL